MATDPRIPVLNHDGAVAMTPSRGLLYHPMRYYGVRRLFGLHSHSHARGYLTFFYDRFLYTCRTRTISCCLQQSTKPS